MLKFFFIVLLILLVYKPELAYSEDESDLHISISNILQRVTHSVNVATKSFVGENKIVAEATEEREAENIILKPKSATVNSNEHVVQQKSKMYLMYTVVLKT